MSKHNPSVVNVETLSDAKIEIQNIGSDPESISIMAPKAVFRIIKFKNIILQDAIIIKQDMLSIGGEVAIPKNAFELKKQSANILIMGTIRQLSELVEKLNRHYPRMKEISNELSNFLNSIC